MNEGNAFYNHHPGNVNSKAHQIEAKDAVPEAGEKIAATVGTDWATYSREMRGMSAFALHDGQVYHTYSAYERGLDSLWGMYQYLDPAPFGRNEVGDTKWFKRHDEYGDNGKKSSCCH